MWAHNEIYKLLQIPRLGFRSRCLMPQHVLSSFTKWTKCLLGHLVCPHPTGLITKRSNITLTLAFVADSVGKCLKVLKSLEQLSASMTWMKAGLKRPLIAANFTANLFIRKSHIWTLCMTRNPNPFKRWAEMSDSRRTPCVCRAASHHILLGN